MTQRGVIGEVGGNRMIAKHDCQKDVPAKAYQYELYGIGKVVANPRRDGSYRCTICGEIIPGIKAPKKNKE